MLNLKCEGISLWGNYQQSARWESTRKFLKGKTQDGSVLDIGPENEFGRKMASVYMLDYNNTGNRDLNEAWWIPMLINNVFCFEVLEHLMNPLLFLDCLKKYVNKKTKIFISYPYRKFDFLWGNTHFHELRPEAFKTLLHKAGYEIIESQKIRIWGPWWFYLTGIRPFLRFLVVLFGWSVHNIYLVRKL